MCFSLSDIPEWFFVERPRVRGAEVIRGLALMYMSESTQAHDGLSGI